MTADAGFVRASVARVRRSEPFRAIGRVRSCVGPALDVVGLRAGIGARCAVEVAGAAPIEAEVIGFRDDACVLMPLAGCERLVPGARVWAASEGDGVPAADACLGRVIDARGRPLDGGPRLALDPLRTLAAQVVPALERAPIREPLDVGVRSINGLLSVGRGARLGLFAGSGVGKSTLLGQIARYTSADCNVIALVGERGREVREFLERDLGDALAHSIVVVATGDEAPLLRIRAAHLASALAEQLRLTGRHVLLLMDSLTRFSFAVREIGLAAGEPPTTRGYTPSVFRSLPQLLERAGNFECGSITGIYSVLVDGDDMNEPVADAARSILDGHIVLARRLAERGQFPPVDVLASVSRVMNDVVSSEHAELARRARRVLADYAEAADLISIGAYVDGASPAIDEARARIGAVERFLRQTPDERGEWQQTLAALRGVFGGSAS
ncbi:MAG: FliI/YscN family ATPase [Myxococcales bacterium]|nr:FliI/YscN family ATPase [Myxococcales bacterium]